MSEILSELFKNPLNTFLGLLEKAINSVINSIPDVILPAALEGGVQIPRLAQGGLVGGVGTGTSDSNLAMLSRGEFVTNAAATSRNLPLLKAINNGQSPQMGGTTVINNIEITGNLDQRGIDMIQGVIEGSPDAVGNAMQQYDYENGRI